MGDVVVTIVDAGVESLIVWLGLSSLGAIEAATNPEFRGRMLAYAINNCRPNYWSWLRDTCRSSTPLPRN